MSDIINLNSPATSKLLTAVGYAVVVLPAETRSAFVDRLLDEIDLVLSDGETSPSARKLITVARRKVLSCVADASLDFKLEHHEELNAVAREDEYIREKRRISVSRARHKKNYIDKYKPPPENV